MIRSSHSPYGALITEMRDFAIIRCKCMPLGFAYAASGKEGGKQPFADRTFEGGEACVASCVNVGISNGGFF